MIPAPEPQISASILTADFSRLGDEVERAVGGGVDSIHLDVMDGQFVDNITMGPVVVEAIRTRTTVPFHSHLMIRNPLRYADRFAEAGSDLIVFHVEADDDPPAVIAAIEAAGRRPGIALNPETPAGAVMPWLDRVDLLLVMTVHPGWGGQAFIPEVLPKMSVLAREIADRGLDVPVRRGNDAHSRHLRGRPGPAQRLVRAILQEVEQQRLDRQRYIQDLVEE